MSDYQLFKYRSINDNLIRSLETSTLFFARPDRLNDPFDCQVDIRKSLELAANKSSGFKKEILLKIASLDNFIDDIHRRREIIGICSFSLDLNIPLMWAHYADDHKGVCLLYEFSEEFFLVPEHDIVGVSEVVCDDNALSDWLVETIPEKIDDSYYDSFVIELLRRVLIVKAEAWAYEKEARVIRQTEGPFEVPKESLKQVCFGLRTPDSDETLVREMIDRAGYTVDYCKIYKTNSDFGFEAREI